MGPRIASWWLRPPGGWIPPLREEREGEGCPHPQLYPKAIPLTRPNQAIMLWLMKQTIIASHLADPGSQTKAIKAKCFDCQGFDSDPCWRWRIGNCPSQRCGLYTVRPYQSLHGSPVPSSLARHMASR